MPYEAAPADWVEADVAEEAEHPSLRTLIAAGLAGTALVGWAGIVVYAAITAIRPSGDRLLDLFMLLPVASTPAALIALVWLVAQRTSRREARRFGRTAAAMRAEAAGMEAVLARIGQSIEENRRLLADQADQLLALGEEASSRLAQVRGAMASESAELGRQSDGLARAATLARTEMTALLADLPRAEAQSRDLSGVLREAGVAAHAQAGALATQVAALTARAQEADAAANDAGQRLAANLAGIETQGRTAAATLGEAAERLRAQVDEVLAAAAAALAETRSGIDAQGAAQLALIDQSRAALDRAGEEAAVAFGERLDGAAERLETLGRRLVEQDSASRALVAKLEAGLSAVEEKLAALDESGRERTGALEQAVGTLRGQTERAILAMRDGDEAAERLGVRAEALREAVDAIGREIDSLPPSLDASEAAAQRSRAAVAAAGPEVARLEAAARAAADRLSRVQAGFAEQQAALDRLGDGVSARIAEIEAHGRALEDIEGRFAGFGDAGAERTADLAEAIVALSGHAQAITQTFGGSVAAAETLAERTATLLEGLAGARTALADTLPEAVARVQDSAEQARASVAAALPEAQSLDRTIDRAVARLGAVDEAAAARRAAVDESVAASESRLAALAAELERLRDGIARIGSEADDVTAGAAPRLVEAMLRARETANAAAAAARETLAAVVPGAAAALGEAVGTTLEGSVAARVEEQMRAIAAAAERAVTAAHRASDRLMRQMLTITDTTSAIEARIEEAQAQLADRDEESFSRRTALLIEALNSTAIDVAKVLSTDVADSAWSAYLRGDRGVFTRRAVRLLEAADVREIARHYEERPDFRDQVNRYIHDFEAMLRRVLAARDGAPMSVTLLSSDMGKLYVALAQAIERLRA